MASRGYMNERTRKGIAASKGRLVYYLTEDEAAVIERMRGEAYVKNYEARRAALLRCKWKECGDYRNGPPAKRDGYCGVHWKMIERWGYDPATYDPDKDGRGPRVD